MSDERYKVLKQIIASNRWRIDLEKGEVKTRRGVKRNADYSDYDYIRTTLDGKSYGFGVHEIICVASGMNLCGLCVNHINGNKKDNRLTNLEAVSLIENTRHAINTGLIQQHGELSSRAKLTTREVLEIRRLLEKGVPQSSLARKFNVFQTTISKIKNNQTWRDIS